MNQPLTAAVRFLSGEREPVRVATTGNLTSMQGLLVIDDVELEVGDRVLVKDQSDAAKNGIWLASEGPWYRAPDASYTRAINEGVTVQVQEGTANNGKTYRFGTPNPVVGTDAISIQFFLSANFLQDSLDELGVLATSIVAVNEGSGTANAIQAATALDVDSSALVVLPIVETNTASPVTVSFNGDAPLSIKTNSGNDVEVGGLVAGGSVLGRVSGSTFRLMSDQASAAIAAAAEASAAAAQAAAEAAALRDPVTFSLPGNGTTGPYDVGEEIAADSAVVLNVNGVTQIVGADFTYVGSSVTFVSIAPTSSDVVHGLVFASRGIPVPAAATIGADHLTHDLKQNVPSLSENAALVDQSATQLKLQYHKVRGAWHIRAFGTSLTDVGSGSASVDTAALQSAMASGEVIDITGAQLQVNNTIVCNLESSKIGAAIESHRPAGESSGVLVVDNTLPIVFSVGHDNFEASGFYVRGQNDNEFTTAFHFERTVDTYRDIDARLINMSLNIMGRAAYVKGRGLELSGCTVSDLHVAAIDLDQPATWTPRGSASIDGIDTGTRGFRFNNNRAHAMQAPFVRNTGTYALNIGGIEINGLVADIGADGGLLQGVMIDLMASGIQCRYSAQAGSRLFELNPGSRNCTLANFNAAGYIGGSGNRMSNHAMRMTSSLANPIRDIFIIGGTIGPTLQAGVNLLGDGAYDNIVFSSVVWKGIGQDGGARSPIQIASTVPSSVIKLIGTHGRDNFTSQPFLAALNTPANNTLYREVTATIDGSFSAWATAGVVQPT